MEPDARTPEFWRVTGRIVDRVVYLGGCQTCAGPYRYCRQRRHTVPSITKSRGPAVTLLRLAQTDGEHVFKLKIKAYVTVTAARLGLDLAGLA